MKTLQRRRPVLLKPLVETVTTIVTPDGQYYEIFKCEESGRVITREKIDTVTKVFHPGIVLGKDIHGRLWIAHNHYSHGKPMCDVMENFSNVKKPIWDNRPVLFTREEILQRTITEVLKGQKYNALNYNCQTFVNLIVRNEHESEAVDRITNPGMVVGGLLALFGALAGNKTMVGIGIGIAGVSGAAKGYSRLR